MSTLAESYYQRDLSMKLNVQKQIINSLKKLGYININYDNKIKQYIDNNLSKMILNNNYSNDKSINYYIDIIKNTTEFNNYSNYVKHCIERSKDFDDLLLEYEDANIMKTNYNNCTDEELYYLGYEDTNILRKFYNTCTDEELYYLGY